MPYKTRSVTCATCGKPMVGRYKPNPPWRCFECGQLRMVGNIRTMHSRTGPDYEKSAAAGREVQRQIVAKEGPLYERWRAGMRAAQEKWVQSADPPSPCH